ncbi:GrpB family protein [Spirosoma daeguense]
MLIQEYQESWIEDFAKVKKVIIEAMANLKISVEHIGSTSVPGLAAKPIIDIDVVYDGPLIFDEIKTRLTKIGYYHNGNQGVYNREVFKRHKISDKHEIVDSIAHHLYVCPVDSEELRRHILFRNYLTLNEEARNQYQILKYKIAEEVNQDRKKYAEVKEIKAKAFVNSIIAKASNLPYQIFGT